MIDLEKTLTSDAELWNGHLRPPLDFDEQVQKALRRGHRSGRPMLPLLAAALIVLVAAALALTRLSFTGHNASPGGEHLAPITGVVWADPDSSATVVYTSTTMRLDDGCTNALAYLHVENGALVQGSAIGPASACTQAPSLPGLPGTAAQRAEQRRLTYFYAVVAGPASWSRSGNVLTLRTPGKGIVHLTTTGTPAPMVVGTSWQLAYYAGTDSDAHPAPMPPIRFTIQPNGSFTAGITCGALVGKAHVALRSIQFTNISGTSCAAGLDAAGNVVMAIIDTGHAAYTIRQTQLIIYGSRGRLLVYHQS